MRGRRPSGPECVERLAGSDQAKERLQVVLQTLAGTCRVQEACRRLGVSEPRFHQLRTQVLEAALERLEPRPAGRPAQAAEADGERLAVLADRLAAKEVELRAAEARVEIALALPGAAPEAAPAPEKKTSQARPVPKRPRPGKRKRT
jgi:helix-turn-helix protein